MSIWYCTLNVRREHAQGLGEHRRFGPFASKVSDLDLYMVIHAMGWEPVFRGAKFKTWKEQRPNPQLQLKES